jgi:hypothetical protein
MNTFCEHHQNSIKFGNRCFDRILLNALIRPDPIPRDDGAKTVGGAGDRALSLKIALPRRLIKIFRKAELYG